MRNHCPICHEPNCGSRVCLEELAPCRVCGAHECGREECAVILQDEEDEAARQLAVQAELDASDRLPFERDSFPPAPIQARPSLLSGIL